MERILGASIRDIGTCLEGAAGFVAIVGGREVADVVLIRVCGGDVFQSQALVGNSTEAIRWSQLSRLHEDGSNWHHVSTAGANVMTWEAERAATVIELDCSSGLVIPIQIAPAGS